MPAVEAFTKRLPFIPAKHHALNNASGPTSGVVILALITFVRHARLAGALCRFEWNLTKGAGAVEPGLFAKTIPPSPRPPFQPTGRERVALCRQACRQNSLSDEPLASVCACTLTSRPSPTGGLWPALTSTGRRLDKAAPRCSHLSSSTQNGIEPWQAAGSPALLSSPSGPGREHMTPLQSPFSESEKHSNYKASVGAWATANSWRIPAFLKDRPSRLIT